MALAWVEESAALRESRLGWALWLVVNSRQQARVPFRSPAAIERLQRRRLREAVAHAHRHVPYYRETMAGLNLTPDDFSTAADLARLPLLERAEVQRDPERFVSDAQPLDRYVPLQTGGSSGMPLTVYADRFALVQRAAHGQRAVSLHRSVVRQRIGCRTLMIGHAPPGGRRPVDRLFARLGRLKGAKVRFASVLDPIERNVDQLDRFRPHILSGPGSYLEELFAFVHAAGRQIHKPRLVRYGADAMSRSGRRLIEDSFGVPVLSVYGAYDAPALGFECLERTGFHLNVDLCPLRIIDERGKEAPDGEQGEVVVSNLVNRGTILLNYRLGDIASKSPGPCPCGRTLPLLSFDGTRKGDWLLLPSGDLAHPATVTEVLEIDRDIFSYQVTQPSGARLTIRIVPRPEGDRDAIRRRTIRGFADLLGPELAVDVEFVDGLPRTTRGKVRRVVSLDRR